MITLHNATDTTFTTNGLGVLEPLSCILNLEINGGWSLEMEYPLDPDKKYLNLEEGKIIKVTGIGVVREQTATYQLFRIYNVNKGLSSLKVTAFPVAFEANCDAVVDEFTTGNSAKTINSLLNDSSTGLMKKLSDEGITKYTCTVNYTNCPSYKMSWKNTNLIAIINGSDDESILNKYDAEVAYDNYTIRINHRLGQDTGFDIRYGKNLTGLDVDTDTSGVVTRFYPISKEGIRYKGSNNEGYIQSDEFIHYPFARSAFIQTDYPLVDTNEKSYSNAAITTRYVKENLTAQITSVMSDIWDSIIGGYKVNNKLYEPEWVQRSLNDIIAEVQASTTLIPADSDAGLANLYRACIKAGMNWIKAEDLADFDWITIDDDKYLSNGDRTLKNQYYYFDKKYVWLDSNGVYHPEKDLRTMDWLNHLSMHQFGDPVKGYGNNTTSTARDEWIFTMNDAGTSFNQYFIDGDGYWDGVSEASEWDWQQTDNKWWFGKTGATNPKDYAHDEWVYIYKSSGSAPYNTPKKYYFGSDGYLLYSESCSWDWIEQKQKYMFGEAVTEQNMIFLKSQWMKIDGDWYFFDSEELLVKDKTRRLGLVNYIISQINAIGLSTYTTMLYNRLYQSMEEYVERLYDEEGYDKPSITVTANVVDLSKTTEYKDFPDLMTIHLGDKVKVIDYVHYPDFEYQMRVVGLQYDCIRGYNTQVTIGDLSKKVSQMISSNLGGKGEQKLVAGENVTIDGNVINAVTNVGDIYAGSQVDVEQIVSAGTELAKIYVDGVPTSIYGTQASITPTQLSGNKIADFNFNGQTGSLYSPPASGLAYWTETEKEIYKLVVAPLPDNKKWDCDEEWQTTNFQQYYHNDSTSSWINPFTEKGTSQLACGFWTLAQHDTQYGGRVQWMFVLISDKKAATGAYTGRLDGYAPYYSEGTAWENDLYLMQAWSPAYIDVPTAQGNLWLETVSGKYKYLPYYEEFGRYPTAAQALAYFLEISNFRISDTYYSGIGNNDGYVIWGGHTIKENPEITDMPFYVTDDGVVRGAEFEDSEGNPISGGGLSKTELYSASSYAATITLSSAYTGYQFLLIQTYNSEDQESLSTMLNVSDLSRGNKVGINDYLLYSIASETSLVFYDSFEDTNHSRRIKAIYGLKTFNGSDVPVIITDVKDGDSSVVSGGVAQISGKQDKLTAGSNIQIAADGKTISATDTTYNEFAGSAAGLVPSVQTQAGKFLKDDGTWATVSGGSSSIDTLTDVDLTSLANGQILKYNSTTQKWENANEVSYSDFAGSTHGLVPEVQTQQGKFLKDDGTWDTPASGSASLDGLTDVDLTSPSDGQVLKYDATNQEWINANESGGTTVVANPSGTATDELEKLQVGNDIFSIPSSEVVTQLITRTSQIQWVLKKNYSNPKTRLGRASGGGRYRFTFSCDSDSDPTTEDVHLEVACPIAIPPTTRKLRVKFTTAECYDTDPRVVVGLKTTYNSSYSSYEYYDDTDWVQRWYDTTENYTYEREYTISTTVPLYFYFIANGWNLTLDSVEIVEVAGGGGDTVVVTPIVTTGTKIATISVNGTSFDLYAPSGGGELTNNVPLLYDSHSFENAIGLEGEIVND